MVERFPGDDKRRVLEATDLVRLVGEHVALKRKGREWACVCPFHDDHNPSMYVVPHKQIYHCFVCGAGGDAISFVMNYHKMGFREALQLLADRAGIELAPLPRRGGGTGAGDGAGGEPGGDPEGGGGGLSRERLLQTNASAQEFFRAILAHAEHGKAARALLERRGVSAEMIELFGIGAAPARWDGLIATMSRRGVEGRVLAAAGLAKAREGGGGGGGGGGFYDVMRNRITFPIHDSLGRVIAFGGRRIDDADEPKYLNSPESLVFNKSATLYGLPMASAAIRERNCAIVTEGYMDCIACHQAGVRHVVATLGTALNALGARVLRRLCEQVVLLFDGDEAGQRAADRAIEVLFAEPIDVRIAVMSSVPLMPGEAPAKDPDELLKRADGRARFEAMVGSAVEALEYRFGRLKARLAGQTLAGRSRLIEDEIARLGELGLARVSPVRRHMIVRRVAALAGVPERVVAEAVSRRAVRSPAMAAPAPEAGAPPRGLKQLSIREQMIACVLSDCTLLDELSAEERALLLSGPAPGEAPAERVDAIAGAIADLIAARERGETGGGSTAGGGAISLREVLGRLEEEGSIRLATHMSASVDAETDEQTARLAQTWADCVRRWRVSLAEQIRPTDPLAMAVRVVHDRRQHGADPRRMPRRAR